MRTYRGRPFALPEHLRRLAASAAAVKIQLPVSLEQLGREVEQTVAASKNRECYIRVMVTRGQSGWGLAPDSVIVPGLRVVLVRELSCLPATSYTDGVSAITFQTQRLGDEVSRQHAKLGNYLTAVLATDAARLAGAHEALLVTASGRVIEGATSNIFFVRRGRLCTPPVDAGILDGITRGHLLAVAESLGLAVDYECPDPRQLYEADELMISSSIRELVPVTCLDGHVIGRGRPATLAAALLEAFRARVLRDAPSTDDLEGDRASRSMGI
jgi:branched-chain amino acid aminotransferase